MTANLANGGSSPPVGHVLDHDTAALLTVPALLTVGTVAELLDCSPRTIRRRIAEGTLPAVIEHDRLMVRADELREYIAALDRPSSPARRQRARSAGGRFDFLKEPG
jgi:excisionase family DNA binding protein